LAQAAKIAPDAPGTRRDASIPARLGPASRRAGEGIPPAKAYGPQKRRHVGIEAARIILGHHSAAITEVYAERDEQEAIEAITKVG
jgi:hypothetical protein